jgi:hypothetical protein
MLSLLPRRSLVLVVVASFPSIASNAAENLPQQPPLQQSAIAFPAPPASRPPAPADAAALRAVEPAIDESATGVDADPDGFDQAGIDLWWRHYQDSEKPQ